MINIIVEKFKSLIKFIKSKPAKPRYNPFSNRYLLVEGYIKSKNDGDEHFINGRALIRCYGLNPSICDVSRINDPWVMKREMIERGYKEVLYPRYDGDYRC